MMFWDSGKAPAAVEDFDIDWTVALNGDTITASSWAITGGDAPASGTLAITSNSFTTTLAKVVLSAGNLGITYTLTNTVTTAAGQTLVESVQLPVRAPVVSLTTLANALQWLGLTADDDGYVSRVLATISTEIQNWLGFQVAQASYSRSFDGQGTSKFFVPDIPLVSVQSLTIDGVTIPKGVNGTYRPGFYNNNQSINLIGFFFTRGFQNIQAGYTSGYQTVPPDIEQACLDWTKNVYLSGKQVSIPSNIVRVAAGDTSFDYGGSGSVTDVTKLPMPSGIYAVLQNYRRVTQISGW
ncbi:hypothetical protein [Bradyrhizobium erythrophlei]|uniref:Uncharacterized protein n=1 Tax=Bradyrhizobium erythrophlei TaxID=1437360 RepID=A0A1M5NPN3_9BRAD|nr:hypothetical protein [Bradyrhizobium erythrophlei]SHG91492.1 hypothetical protein SAMN05443248_3072 [Bradyrhizobium erythrophlei]